MQTKITDLSELEVLKAKSLKQNYLSTFNFINQHKGFRNGKLHLCLGTPSGGKSTLRNSLIYDFLKVNNTKKVFLWLSEESIEDFKIDVSCNEFMNKHLDRISIFSEQDEQIKDFGKMANEVFKSGCDLFIFDNITTSRVYGSRFNEQNSFALNMKNFITDNQDISIFMFAHTSSNIKQNNISLIDQNDIRGSKDIINLVEFLYILQQFYIEQTVISTIRITKHRGYNISKRLFGLSFDKSMRIYLNDGEVSFNEFNQLYKRQNRLGKSSTN